MDEQLPGTPAAAASAPMRTELVRVLHEPQPFSVPGLIARGFRLYLSNFVPFVALAFLTSLPSMMLKAAALAPAMSGFEAGISLFAAAVAVALEAVLVVACVHAVRGRPVRLAATVRAVLPSILSLAVMYTIFFALATAGFALLFVPGLWVMGAFYVAGTVTLVERRSAIDALKRTYALTRGHRLGCAALALGPIGLSVALTMLARRAGFSGSVSLGLTSLTAMLVAPLDCAIAVLAYIDLRGEKEPELAEADAVDAVLARLAP